MALTPASILADYSSGIGTQGATLKVDANNERVGIGTTNPQGTLQVGTAITMGSGIVTATSFDASTASFSGNVSVGGVLTYEDVTSVDSVGIVTARSGVHIPNGDIGIGTDDTSLGRAVFFGSGGGNGQGPILSLVRHSDTPATNDRLGSFNFYGKDSDDNTVNYKSVYTRIVDPTSGSATGQLCIGTDTSTSGRQVIIDADGSVGIGTDDITEKLHVVGDARVTGILTVGTASLTLNGTTGAITGGSLTNAQVAAISSEISESDVVDVFVYDTRKDSDGGAWRKRTQHTSWYNETLNTATRGSRKDFPAVAVIVTTSDGSNDSNAQVIIYDGDDPDLPMWMVFQASGGVGPTATRYAIPGVNDLKASMMLNGTLCVAVNDVGSTGRAGLEIINFLSETTEHLSDVADNGNVRSEDSIAKRNTTLSNLPTDDSRKIVENASNDVAMTVLPNATIDPSTGLPIPTIALATDSGVSVIKDDGTVVDAVGTTFDVVNSISFDKNNRIICSSGTDGTDQAFFSTFIIPSSDISHVFPGGDNAYYRDGYGSTDLPWYGTGSAGNHSIYEVSSYGDYISFGTEDDGSTTKPGLKILSENITTPSEGMLCGVSTSYNTGWMHGDIKGAFLSGISTTSLVANTNLASSATQSATARLTSETYTDGATSWQMVDNAGDDNGYLAIVFGGLTTGQRYHLSMTVDANAALDAGYQHKIEQGGDITYLNHWNGTGAATLTTNFTAISGTNALYFYVNAITVNVTNFNIRAVDDEDRSVNNNGLAVYGTITKSAVATGAELVSYSGFSASNYLQQPYNADFLFGTDDFCITGWVNNTVPSDSVYEDIITFGNIGIVGYSNMEPGTWLIQMNKDYGFNMYYATSTGTASSGWSNFNAGGNFQKYSLNGLGIWYKITIVRIGSQIYSYVNDDLFGSQPISGSFTTSSNLSDMRLTFGYEGGSNYGPYVAQYTKVALWRISRSAPSPEQVKKMYEDEKVLFQENAACTLYGSSDAVTALSFDEDTELLHVGTSSGRSDFQGLRRINNTTTAVTTAISASNGLVAEE